MDVAHVVRWEKTTPPSENEAEARLRTEGYDCFTWNDVPGSSYPPHRHDADECIWVIQGGMTFQIGDETFVLKPGDRLYLPAKLPHTAEVSVQHGATYMVGKKD